MSSESFRRIALSLPDVIEGSHQGHADFRVVWYVHHRGTIIISCFVPADAV